jgi:hypothetical protein
MAVQLAICAVIGAALLRFIPPKASRTWAMGLLIFMMLGNLGPVIGVVVAQFSPPSFYLETEKNRLEFNRGPAGEVFGVRVNTPPPEFSYLQLGDRTWAVALGNITLTLVALALWRRAGREAPPAAGMANPGLPASRPLSAAGA